MEVLYPRCAGLDVHARCVNACVRIAAGRKTTTEHREFATTTAGLLDLAAWLTEASCTHVAMEATGVYWKPVWHTLEDEESLTLVLANPQHIRNVPGRKSDRKDAAWIADLLAHGLIEGSFVPPVPIQELRMVVSGALGHACAPIRAAVRQELIDGRDAVERLLGIDNPDDARRAMCSRPLVGVGVVEHLGDSPCGPPCPGCHTSLPAASRLLDDASHRRAER